LLSGAYESLPAPDGVWAFRRGTGTRVVANLTDDEVEVFGERLAPWQGVLQRM
jgi:hypothetical protein